MMEIQTGAQFLMLIGALVLVLLWMNRHGCLPTPLEEGDPEAEERAVALQQEVLTEQESRQLAQWGYLTVPSPSTPGRTYRVPARPGWVDVYESDRLERRLCVEAVTRLPAADVVVMHKLMIEGNEEGYLRQANVVYLRVPGMRRWRGEQF